MIQKTPKHDIRRRSSSSEPSRNTAAPYAFRCMASGESAAPTAKPDGKPCEGVAFQPLFKSNGFDGRHADPEEQAAQIEQARCRGMQNGLDSGRIEASRLARSALSPSLKAFILTLNELSAASQQMKEQVSAKVIELALSISQRVIGESPSLTVAAMNDLKVLLGDTLSRINRIGVHLNPADVQGIKDLLAADGIEWSGHPQVGIESDNLVPPGEVRIADSAISRGSLDASVLSALSRLLASKHPDT